jgi:protein-disulfide isomerase
VPPIGPHDHVRGDGRDAIVYLDLACPACAAEWLRIRELPIRLCLRHFPIESKRPRAAVLHAAAEAAGMQRESAFWEMVDSLCADQGHVDDPHLWHRARALSLDLERFEADRRSEAVAGRIETDFRSGIRAGVTSTPAGFLDGELVLASLSDSLAGL